MLTGYAGCLIGGSLIIGCRSLNELTPVDVDVLRSVKVLAVASSEGFDVGSTSPKTAYNVTLSSSS